LALSGVGMCSRARRTIHDNSDSASYSASPSPPISLLRHDYIQGFLEIQLVPYCFRVPIRWRKTKATVEPAFDSNGNVPESGRLVTFFNNYDNLACTDLAASS
jgi:hypothetical protein